MDRVTRNRAVVEVENTRKVYVVAEQSGNQNKVNQANVSTDPELTIDMRSMTLSDDSTCKYYSF